MCADTNRQIIYYFANDLFTGISRKMKLVNEAGVLMDDV